MHLPLEWYLQTNLDVMKSSVSLATMLQFAFHDLLSKAEEEAINQYLKDLSDEHAICVSGRTNSSQDQSVDVEGTTQICNATEERVLESKTSDDKQDLCCGNNPIVDSVVSELSATKDMVIEASWISDAKETALG